MNRRAVLGLVGGAMLSTGLAACGSGTGVDLQSGFAVGNGSYTRIAPGHRDKAPVLTGSTLDGAHLSTADYPGKVLVINVWGSWCAPCRHEAPTLVHVADATKDIAQFVGIDTRDLDVAPAKAFVRAFAINYPSLYDPSGELLLKFSQIPPAAIPSTLVIDASGGIAARVIGEVDRATLLGTVTDVAGGK